MAASNAPVAAIAPNQWFAANHLFGAIAATGALLAAIYLLWPYQRVFYGKLNEAHAGHPDMSKREWVFMAPVLVSLLVVGIFPNLLLSRINPSVDLLLMRVGPAQTQVVEVPAVELPGGPTDPGGEP